MQTYMDKTKPRQERIEARQEIRDAIGRALPGMREADGWVDVQMWHAADHAAVE